MENRLKTVVAKELSDRVLMMGVRWRNYAPGGIASVVNTYSEHFETLNYIETAASRDDSVIRKFLIAVAGMSAFFLQMLFNRKIRIVHIQGSYGASYDRKKYFVKIARFFGKKVIWHMHASRFISFYSARKDKEDIVRNLNMADCVIVLSECHRDFYSGIGVESSKIVILGNPVSYPAIREKVPDNKVHFLFLGEISDRKGVFDILKAIELCPDLQERISLRIGGNGETEKLENAIKKAGLEKCVHFQGWVCSESKIDLLNWADVFLLPSFNEGLPVSILEAMSYNCPIISSPVGGIPELVTEANGLLVNPGDVTQIAKAMLYYVNNPDKIRQHGSASGKMVRNYYPNAIFKRLDTLYNNLL